MSCGVTVHLSLRPGCLSVRPHAGPSTVVTEPSGEPSMAPQHGTGPRHPSADGEELSVKPMSAVLQHRQMEPVSGSSFTLFVNGTGREGCHRLVSIQKHLASVGLGRLLSGATTKQLYPKTHLNL